MSIPTESWRVTDYIYRKFSKIIYDTITCSALCFTDSTPCHFFALSNNVCYLGNISTSNVVYQQNVTGFDVFLNESKYFNGTNGMTTVLMICSENLVQQQDTFLGYLQNSSYSTSYLYVPDVPYNMWQPMMQGVLTYTVTPQPSPDKCATICLLVYFEYRICNVFGWSVNSSGFGNCYIGHLDKPDATEFESRLIATSKDLYIDLGMLTWIDSTGLTIKL
jgi:hypothetical protein